MEPYIAHQQWPPALEPVAAAGPTHTPAAPIDTLEDYNRFEEDYTFWRYSKFALPFLLFILGIYAALLCLTAWQARSDIRFLYDGVPRDLEAPASQTDRLGGIPKYKFAIRFAVTTCAILFSLLLLLIFFTNLKPTAAAGATYPLAFLLFLTSILAFVAFGLDVNSEKDGRRCSVSLHATRVCVSREDMLTGVTIWDAGVAVFGLTSSILIFCYTSSGDWTRQREGFGDDRDAAVPGATPNGVSNVRKTITALALLATLFFAILLLVFTIISIDDRDRFVVRDRWNRKLDPANPKVTNTNPGWPIKNTKLRYAVSSFAIITILFNLIPLTSRVIAYILAFLYVCYIVLSFVVFALDINAIDRAKSLSCPNYFSCKYHPYAASTTLDFLGGFFLIIYILAEYFALRKCAHCERSYGIFEVKKHEQELCPRRRVVCEVCSKEMTAKEFVFKHRFDCGVEHTRCDSCQLTIPEWSLGEHLAQCPKARTARPVMGVDVADTINEATGTSGVVVMDVHQGSAAALGGVQAGDIIARWNSTPIFTKDEFAACMRSVKVGEEVSLQCLRSAGSSRTAISCRVILQSA